MHNDALRRINTMETFAHQHVGFRPETKYLAGNDQQGTPAEQPSAYPPQFEKYDAWAPRDAAAIWPADNSAQAAQHDEQWLQCFQALASAQQSPPSLPVQQTMPWEQGRAAAAPISNQGSHSRPMQPAPYPPQSAPAPQAQTKKQERRGGPAQPQVMQPPGPMPLITPPSQTSGMQLPPGMFPIPMPPGLGMNGMHPPPGMPPMIPIMHGVPAPGMQFLGFACVPVPQEKAAPDSEYHDDITLMLRNLPNKITQVKLLSRLQSYRQSIDFLYLPTDFENKCNLGYAFINFIDGAAARRFQQEFNDKKLPGCRRSTKVLAVQPARVQGVNQNVRRFRNSSVMGVLPDEEKPMLFRNGMQIPFPTPDGPLPPVGPRYPREPDAERAD
jgi:hypothetical protein